MQSISIASLLQYPLLEAVVWSCSVKQVFLKIFQNSQVFLLVQEFPVNFAKFKETFFRKTPTVIAFRVCTIRDLLF